VAPKTNKMKQVTLMLKAIHAQESKEAAQEKAASIAAKLREMKLLSSAKKVARSAGYGPSAPPRPHGTRHPPERRPAAVKIHGIAKPGPISQRCCT